MSMRIANGVVSAVFLLSAVVQYNDSDPLFWIVCYAVAGLFSVLALAGIYTGIAALLGLAYFFGAVYHVPGWNIDMVLLLMEPKMYSVEVELTREAFGLFICGIWMSVLAYVWYRRKGK